MYRACFVCTGNICRSPMAESVFRSHVADAGHLRDLRALAPTADDATKVRLLRSYDPAASADQTDVPDPYYGPLDGFEECLQLVEAASPGLLAAVSEAVKEHTP